MQIRQYIMLYVYYQKRGATIETKQKKEPKR